MVYVTYNNGEVQSYDKAGESVWIKRANDFEAYHKIFYKKGEKEVLIAYVKASDVRAIGFEKPDRVTVPTRALQSHERNQVLELLEWWSRERARKTGRAPMKLDSAINTLKRLTF